MKFGTKLPITMVLIKMVSVLEVLKFCNTKLLPELIQNFLLIKAIRNITVPHSAS